MITTLRTHPRLKIVTAASCAGLVAVAGLIWSMPEIHRPTGGPSAAEIALQREEARAQDLSGQLASAQERLDDRTSRLSADLADATARANDLAAQLEAANAQLQAPDENAAAAAQAGVAQARAEALRGELTGAQEGSSTRISALSAQAGAAQARAEALRSAMAAETAAAQARADDLKSQLDAVQAEPVATASLTRQQIIDSRTVFGIYTKQSPFSYAEVDHTLGALQRDATVVGYFQGWDADFRPDAVRAAWLRGDVPLMTWESRAMDNSSLEQPEYSLPTIYSGQHDDYIRRYARDIKALGLPMIIRLNHEMNGTFYPWSEVRGWDGTSINGNSRGDYVKMWRHVHDIFEAEGANDLVAWMWAPNRIDRIPSQPLPAQFYPGDEYVDLVGVDAYWRVTDLSTPPTFDSTFGKTLPLLRAFDKPLWIAETGATDTGGFKAAWTRDFFAALQRPENADIRGFMSFSLTVTSNQGTNDWSFISTGAVTTAAREGLAASGFGRPV